jgi:hypothetical protein
VILRGDHRKGELGKRFGDLCILAIEDHASMRQTRRTMFRHMGVAKAHVATDWTEGRSLLEAHPEVELLVAEWAMEAMGGLEILKAVRGKAAIQTPCASSRGPRASEAGPVPGGGRERRLEGILPEQLASAVVIAHEELHQAIAIEIDEDRLGGIPTRPHPGHVGIVEAPGAIVD